MYINSSSNVSFSGFAEATRVVSQLGKTTTEINQLVRRTSHRRKDFLCVLSDRYNSQNFYRKPEEQESPDLVIDIFKMLKRPNERQFSIISHVRGTLENIKHIFEQTGNNSKLLDFAGRLNKIVGEEGRPEMITEILKSPHRTEYMKHFSDYLPYFELRKNDKDAVKTLDSLVANKTYKAADFIKEQQRILIEKTFRFPKTENLNTKVLTDKYTSEGFNLLKEISMYFDNIADLTKNGGDKILSDIYGTTNKNNGQIRLRLLHLFSANFDDQKQKIPDLFELKKLYDAVDANKHAKNFVTKFLDQRSHIDSVQRLNEVLYSIPNKKLDIFSENALNIIQQTRGDETIAALKHEIENPFFETKDFRRNRRLAEHYGFRKRQGVFSAMKTRMKNYFRTLKDKMTDDVPLPQEPENVLPQIKTAVEIPEQVQKQAIPEVKISEVKMPEPQIKEVVKTSKETVIDNIMSIIKEKLGLKTFERQNADYSKGATKMRLKLLPEIFASISDTRKADRAVGKKHINSSNKDALTLFQMINGSNRKFVNYLLKKRNSDGTRMFEVKEIINMLKQAEAKIKRDKSANPDYRARDAHRYYNHLYEAKVQQYGKVKQLRKTA